MMSNQAFFCRMAARASGASMTCASHRSWSCARRAASGSNQTAWWKAATSIDRSFQLEAHPSTPCQMSI
jgi:hypothetical protein